MLADFNFFFKLLFTATASHLLEQYSVISNALKEILKKYFFYTFVFSTISSWIIYSRVFSTIFFNIFFLNQHCNKVPRCGHFTHQQQHELNEVMTYIL